MRYKKEKDDKVYRTFSLRNKINVTKKFLLLVY